MSELQSFRGLPECLICQFYTCDLHLRCAVHPYGVTWDSCPDYTPLNHRIPVKEVNGMGDRRNKPEN